MMAYLILLLLPIALITSAIRHVPNGQVYSLHRHGKLARLLPAGTHLVFPLVDRVAHKITLNGQTLRFEEALSDTAGLHGTVYWQVLEPERADAIFEQADMLIRRGTHEALSGTAQFDHADRRVLGAQLKQSLNSHLRERGMMVTRVDLDAA